MKKIVFVIIAFVLSYSAIGQTYNKREISKSSKGIAQNYLYKLKNTNNFNSSLLGVMALNMAGDTLVNFNSQEKMIPASTMKLITTGLALNYLGKDYRFETSIAYSGTIENGELNGNLYIIGGGDPTIGVTDSIKVNLNTIFYRWKSFITDAGINKINGLIIGDGRYFDGSIECESWCYDDLGTYYGAGCNGLSFYRNILDIKVKPGAKIGDDISMSIKYPETPWMNYTQTSTTNGKGNGDKLFLYNTDLSFNAQMRGTLAIDVAERTEKCSNKFGAMTCAYYFYKYLNDSNLSSKGYAQIDGYGKASEAFTGVDSTEKISNLPYNIIPNTVTTLGKTYSPTLKQIAYMTNYRSDNFYAETLMRAMGRKFAKSANYSTCQKYYYNALKQLGLNTSYGIDIEDGSGLSRKNYVSPEFFCRFLKAMANSKVYEDYLSILASPGKPHYKSRLKDKSESVKSRIFLKSGSMNGVRCFSGYILSSDGDDSKNIVFSIMTNNNTKKDWVIYPILDQIIESISFEN